MEVKGENSEKAAVNEVVKRSLHYEDASRNIQEKKRPVKGETNTSREGIFPPSMKQRCTREKTGIRANEDLIFSPADNKNEELGREKKKKVLTSTSGICPKVVKGGDISQERRESLPNVSDARRGRGKKEKIGNTRELGGMGRFHNRNN